MKPYKPERHIGFHFSSNVDRSSNDRCLYIQGDTLIVTIGARYKNSDPSHLYEMEMNKKDLMILSNMLVNLSMQMEDTESEADQ